MERNGVPEGLRCAVTYAEALAGETPEGILTHIERLLDIDLINEKEAEQILELLEDGDYPLTTSKQIEDV